MVDRTAEVEWSRWGLRATAALAVAALLVLGPGLSGARADTYTVESGDTLSEIARDHGVSMATLMERNGITDPHRLRVGESLDIDGSSGAGSYVVQPGDVLGIVARDHGVSLSALIGANDITDPNRIVAGTTLVVPAGGTAPVVAATRNLPDAVLDDPAKLALVPVFERWAAANAIDAELLMAVAWQESGWNNGAVSSVGAIGIGQLMPATSAWVAADLIGRPELDPTDPEDNIRMSARYLRWLQAYMGSTEAALAGYFQGPNAVLAGVENERTDRYVANVLALRDRFA